MADRSVLVRLRADISDFQRKFATAGATTSAFVKNLESADSRMGNLVQTALALAPALVPIGATGVPALAGIATQAGFAAAGIGVLVAAFNGIGDTLEAVNKYQLDPTDENLKKMRLEMKKLPEEGRHFVRFLDREVMPALDWLQDSAAKGMLPGAEESITSLMERLPEASRLVEDLARASSELATEASDNIASDRMEDFFQFLRDEAEPSLKILGRTVGNVLDGLSSSLIGLNPLANDFEDALYDWSKGFADIEPEDFTDFVAYVREVGPDAFQALSAMGGALVALVEAAAPVGSVTLPVIESLSKVIEVIADSPAGPALIGTAAGLAAISRAIALFQAANGSALVNTLQGVGKASPGVTSGLGRMNQTISAMKTGAPILAGIALAYSDVDDKAGLSNTAMLATTGLIAGPWGAAIGTAVGLLLDWKAAGAQAEAQARAFDAALQGATLEELNDGLAEAQALMASLDQDNPLQPVLADRTRAIEDQIQATEDLAAAREAEHRETVMAYAEEVGLALKAADSTRMTTEQVEAQAKAMEELNSEADSVSDSFLTFPDSVNKASVSLHDFITDMRETADALEHVNDNSIKAAKNGLDEGLIRSLRKLGPEGALRLKQFADANETEIGRANAAQRAYQAQIERSRAVTRNLAGLSPVKIDVNAQTGAAMTNLKSLENYLRSIKDEDVFVNIRHRQYGKSGGFGPVDSADGSTVPDDGGPYTDRFLYRLAPREEVVSDRFGGATRNRRELKAASRGAKLRVVGLADGGTAGGDDESDDPTKPKKPPKPLPFGLPAETAALIRQFGSLRKALAASEKAVDNESKRRDYLQTQLDTTAQSMANLAEITTSGFMNDPFRNREGASDIWAAGAKGGGVDPIASLDEDIAYGQRRIQLQKQLQDAGLGGSTAAEQAALAEALKGSNDDLAALLSNGQVQTLEDKLIQRQSLGTIAGSGAADMAGLNDVLRSQQGALEDQLNELRDVNAELRALRAEERDRERRDDQRSKDNAQATGQATAEGLNSHARSVARQASRGWKRPA